MNKLTLLIVTLLSLRCHCYSQSPAPRSADVMWKRTVWREIDLRHPNNRGFFHPQQELTRAIIEKAQAGQITGYTSDNFQQAMHKNDILNAMVLTENDPNGLLEKNDTTYLHPRDFYRIELKEEYIFDKNESRFKINIIAINLFLPFDHPENLTHIQRPVASFKYSDLVSTKTIHQSPYHYTVMANETNPISFHQAFQLRKFESQLVKINNHENEYLIDACQGDQKKAHYAGKQIEYEIIDFEYGLWVSHPVFRGCKIKQNNE